MDQITVVRSSYRRAGFGACALYGIFTMAAPLMLGIGIAPVLATVMSDVLGTGDLSKLMQMYFNGQLTEEALNSVWVMFAVIMYVTGSAAGLFIGMIVLKKIIISEYNTPIERRRLSAPEYLLYILIGFSVWGAGIVLGQFPSFFGFSSNAVDRLIESLGKNAWPFYIYTVIGAPILEELVFRKTLIDRLHPYGGIPAAVLSGVLFALMHGNSQQFFLALFIGMLNAVIYLKTGNIFYCMGIHFLINLTGSLDGIFGFFGLNIATAMYIVIPVLAVIGAAAFIYVLVKKRDMLKISPAVLREDKKVYFGNAGIRTAKIAGTVLLVWTDLVAFGTMAMGGALSQAAIIFLLPTLLAALTVFILPKVMMKI